MGLIQKIIESHRQKVQERNLACEQLISRIEMAIRDARGLVSTQQTFIDPSAANEWKNVYCTTLADAKTQNIQRLYKAEKYGLLLTKQEVLFAEAKALPERIHLHNQYIAKKKADEAYALIGDVEGRKLDQQQLNCIVKEAHNHLVIAGAGTGKTTTVVGKVKYLLRSGKCLPSDILVLSFTNASATEMRSESSPKPVLILKHRHFINLV